MPPLGPPFDGPWGLYLLIIVAGLVATYPWRFVGALVAARIDEGSPLFRLVRMMATALVAGLVAMLVAHPSGVLATAPLWLRLGGLCAGVLAYWLRGRSLVWGVVTGEAVIVLGILLTR